MRTMTKCDRRTDALDRQTCTASALAVHCLLLQYESVLLSHCKAWRLCPFYFACANACLRLSLQLRCRTYSIMSIVLRFIIRIFNGPREREKKARKDRSTALAWRVLTAIDFFREKLNRFCYAQAVTINVWRLFLQISYGEQVLRPHTVYTIGSQYIVTSNSYLDMDQEC